MKQRFVTKMFALLLAVFMMFGSFPGYAMADETENDGVVIQLHYHRPDEVYTDWSVWMWADGAEGIDVPLEQRNEEYVATYQVAPGVNKVGFIVKLPGWAAKDVNEDQFIDVSAVVSGTVHVYVESGVKGYEMVYGDDVITGIKITATKYREGQGIRLKLSAALGTDPMTAFTVIGSEGPMTIASVSDDGNNIYTIVTQEPIDLYQTYSVSFQGTEYPIMMPIIYSTETFENEFTYTGDDLGATWTPDKTTFRVWAPTAQAVKVNLYQGGQAGENDMTEQLIMTPDVNGTWVAEKTGDLNGVYYTYVVDVKGQVNEACDPYAKATGVNGQRAMVINMEATNPEGWDVDVDPNADLEMTDLVIYELHVRDLSIDPSSGIKNAGKYLGVIETGTTNGEGVPTGLDHIKNLGVTHIHLLPVYDYGSVDESRLDTPQFNWGYDPVNYNVPEGSYSTDPYNGEVRIAEMKEMVKGLHDNGISVIMDVVYNHVYAADSYCFNKIVPQYFSRVADNGSYSNGSGCGNDTASERSMVKKYIVDSVKYWADEYHIDGFRFDLVGLIDTETINAVIEEVHKDHPNVIFYGEGWSMTTNVTKEGYTMTTQAASLKVPEFAFFSDNIRDMLKGSVFNNTAQGYVSGATGLAASVKECFLARPAWCKTPTQSINYASCHDNMSLYDRLTMSSPDATIEERIRMNNLAAAFYMTAQGVPFMQAGEEMLRSKPLEDGTFDHNSYSSPDSVNSIKWDDLNKAEYQDVYKYYQGLIAFRKAHGALRMTSGEDVLANITQMDGLDENVAAFQINGGVNGETSDGLMVIFNPNKNVTTVALPEGNWNIYITGEESGVDALASVQGAVAVDPISAMVLVREDTVVEEPKIQLSAVDESKLSVESNGASGEDVADETKPGKGNGIVIGAAVAAVAVAGAAAAVILKKKK